MLVKVEGDQGGVNEAVEPFFLESLCWVLQWGNEDVKILTVVP